MKQFNWKEFKNTENKIAVHCKTEEEAKDFCKQMHEHGMTWCDGETFLSDNGFYAYGKYTCYCGGGTRSDVQYTNGNGYTILEWSDYMQKEFTKADLKDGMIIETRTEGKYLVLGDLLIDQNGAVGKDEYNDDLLIANKTVKEDEGFDIVAVYRFCNNGMYLSIKDILESEDYLELIWRRKEAKYMTAEEMRQKLEELTDEKIEIIPSRREMIDDIKNYCEGIDDCDDCVLAKGCGNYGNFDEWNIEQVKECYKKVFGR